MHLREHELIAGVCQISDTHSFYTIHTCIPILKPRAHGCKTGLTVFHTARAAVTAPEGRIDTFAVQGNPVGGFILFITIIIPSRIHLNVRCDYLCAPDI